MDTTRTSSSRSWERWSWPRAGAAAGVLLVTTALAAVAYLSFAVQFRLLERPGSAVPVFRLQWAAGLILVAGVLLGLGPLWVWRRRRTWPWLVAGLAAIALALPPAVICLQGRTPDLPLVP